MLSTRRTIALVVASTLPALIAVGAARAGTLEQAVESAMRGNSERVEEEIRMVQVGRHGFTVDAIAVQK